MCGHEDARPSFLYKLLFVRCSMPPTFYSTFLHRACGDTQQPHCVLQIEMLKVSMYSPE